MDRDKMERLCTAIKTATCDASRTEDMTPLEVVTTAIWHVADLFAAYVYEADRPFDQMTHSLDGLCQEVRRMAEDRLLAFWADEDGADEEEDAGPV
jgi:hypothetical protein